MFLSILFVPTHGLGSRVYAAVVDTGFCGENVTYKLSSDGLLTISGNGEMDDVPDFRDNMFSGSPTPWDKDKVKHVVIDEGVTKIGAYVFSDHYYLMDIQIPKSVVSIGEGAFQYCTSLSSLILPENITSIPKKMCTIADLRYIYIPASVKVIYNSAFYYNDTLIEVEYGGTKTQWKNVVIESGNDDLSEAYMVYKGGSTLSTAQSGICGDNVTWKLTTDGTLKISGKGTMDSYIKPAEVGVNAENYGNGTDHPWYKYRSKIKKIIITSGVDTIGAYAFFDCFNCTSLEIQNGVKTIKEGAFAYIPISSLSLPNSVSTVEKYAFYNCSTLQKVKLSDGITVLNDGTFEYCRNLKSIVWPKNLTRINYSVFYMCDFEEITIPATVTYIGPNFAYADTVRFLGAPPSFENGELLHAFVSADYCYCPPKYYESYKAIFEKWRAEGVLSDGPICATLNKTSLTLTVDEPTYQLTVSDATGSAKSVTKKWWVEKPQIASVDKNGVVTASGHGKTMLHVEISANGYHSMANCEIETKRNDFMVALLPKNIEADFPVTCGITMTSFGEVDICAYEAGKLAETDTTNKYYQQLLSLTKNLTAGCSSDEQKARAIWSWVSNNITYGGSIGIGNHAAQVYEVYLNRKAHCEGFAKLTGFMLYLADIPSCLVASTGHMWNIALLDGTWKMIDSTNGKFGGDHNDYYTINWIGFGTDDFCFVIDNTEGIKLAGVGNHYLKEEREEYTFLKVPDFVDIIFGYAFSMCSNVKEVVLPKSVKAIKSSAFKNCENLKNVYYNGSKSQWKSIDINTGNENLTKAKITYNATRNLPTIAFSSVTISNKKAVLSWEKQNSVSGYEIYMSKSEQGTYKKIKTIKSSSTTKYTTGVLAKGSVYYFKIRAYKNINGKKVYGSYSTFRSVARDKVKVKNPKLYSVTVKDKKAVLTWMRQDSVSGYVVYMSNSEKGSYKAIKTIKKCKTTQYTTGILAMGKTYYFKIRPYKNVSGKKVYGNYSKVKTVKRIK